MRLTQLSSSSSSRTTAPCMAPHESDFRAPATASRSLLWGRCEPPPNLPPTASQTAVCAGDENSRASQQTPEVSHRVAVSTAPHTQVEQRLCGCTVVAVRPVICDAAYLELICLRVFARALHQFVMWSLCSGLGRQHVSETEGGSDETL